MDWPALAGAYTRWWRAIAEPSFIAGVERAQRGAGGVEPGGDVHAEAVRISARAFERYHEVLMEAGPLPMVCDYTVAWLERV